jgi:hypothetical protein
MTVSVANRSANASIIHTNKQIAKLKSHLDGLPPGTAVVVKLKDHSEIAGDLVASSEEDFELRAPEPIQIKFIDVRSMAENPNAQTTPGGSQNAPAKPNHHVRTVVIVLTACVVFAIVAAVASK